MASVVRLNWSRIVLHGVIAGIVGGILIELFLYIAQLLPAHTSAIAAWQFIASTAVGKVAFTSASYAWLGLAMHFCVSIAWAIGYNYLAKTQRSINGQPVISGLVFGLVVYVVMQLVLFSVQLLTITSVRQIVVGIIAHTVFFGLPVAMTTRALQPEAVR
jgi:hypothetical protein